MTSRFVMPPRLAVWFVSLFAYGEEAESVLGDLQEEHTHLALQSVPALARRWYWRQAVKTAAQLAAAGFRRAPWSTTAVITGGFLLRRLTARLVEPAIFGVLDRYQVFERHYDVYRFFASTGIDLGHIISFLLVGFAVALAAKGREMVTTMTLALVFGAMTVLAAVVWVSSGDAAFLWRLPWFFTDSFVVVLGGAIVHSRRFPASTLPSNA